MATELDRVFTSGLTPLTASSRCAVALATLPVVAAHRPDAVVVWFDAHADLNTPENTTTGYLGGLAYSGPLGHWDSGLGSGLTDRQRHPGRSPRPRPRRTGTDRNGNDPAHRGRPLHGRRGSAPSSTGAPSTCTSTATSWRRARCPPTTSSPMG